MKTYVLCAMAVVILVAIGAGSAAADRIVVINNYGVTPFVYGGYSYVPVASTADFLGATVDWNGDRSEAAIIYHRRHLTLVVGSTTAYYGGRAVVLPAAPIFWQNRLMVPTVCFSQYLGVPVRWEESSNQVLFLGPAGWGYYTVAPYAPPPVVAIIQSYPVVFVPGPFAFYGATYVPARDVVAFIGALLLFEAFQDEDEYVINYGGVQTIFVVGSPTCIVGGRTVVLADPPLIVNNQIYVPQELFTRHLGVPIERHGDAIRVKGTSGWHDMRMVTAPTPKLLLAGPRPQARFASLVQRGVAPHQAVKQAAALAPQPQTLIARAARAKPLAAPSAMAAAPKAKAPKPMAPMAAAPKAKAPKAMAPMAAAPKGKAPKAAAPMAAAPKAKAPKAAAPMAAAPKAKAPKAAAPMAAAPKARAPKAAAAPPPQPKMARRAPQMAAPTAPRGGGGAPARQQARAKPAKQAALPGEFAAPQRGGGGGAARQMAPSSGGGRQPRGGGGPGGGHGGGRGRG